MAALDGWSGIAPDLRGMGQSDAPDLGYSMETYAADLAALLDLLAVDKVVLVGHSMGGYIAFEFLRQWRRRVRGLVLIDSRAEADTPEGRNLRDDAAATARETGAGAVADSMLPKVLGVTTLEDDPAVVERTRTHHGRHACAGDGRGPRRHARPTRQHGPPARARGAPNAGDRGRRRRGDASIPGRQHG